MKMRLFIYICLSVLAIACQPMKNTGNGGNFGPEEDFGVDPGMGPTGMTYQDLRQHTYSRAGVDIDPVISKDGKWILFASTRHNQHPDIYIKSIYGPAVTQKTADLSSDLHPSFSPDGKRFAFASNRNGNWDIFVMNTFNRSTPMQITRSLMDEIHPDWSPDGKKLVYNTFSDQSNQWEIWVLDFTTNQSSVLGQGLFPNWSPDGKKILYQRARQRGTRFYSVWTMDADGDNVTEIVHDNNWAAINPTWSPDGSKIVFATVFKSMVSKDQNGKERGDDIWMVNADGTNLIRLTTHDKPDWNPTWGPDGRVYFSSNRNGFTNIWSVKPISIDLVPDELRPVEQPLPNINPAVNLNQTDAIALPQKINP